MNPTHVHLWKQAEHSFVASDYGLFRGDRAVNSQLKAVAYLGGGALGDASPLWPERKNFWNTLNQIFF